MRSARYTSPLLWLLVLVGALAGGCASTKAYVPPPPPAAEKSQRIALPDLPTELRECFAGTVSLPAGPWSRDLAGEIASELRKDGLDKTDCGRRIISFYDDLRQRWASSK